MYETAEPSTSVKFIYLYLFPLLSYDSQAYEILSDRMY